ncbi:MAG: energy-coupled thiamine transporter ThiT [Bacillaceae bacterium]|nr:energy-coupled thiamine transporter ThiT [Bacillaceae bacterium]
MRKSNILFLVECAIFATLALVLDLFSGFLTSRFWPQGGSVSIAMLPIFIIAFRWGLKGGLFSGFLFGLLQVVTGMAWIATPIQGFIDYFLAFALVGFAGVFARQVQDGLQKGSAGKWVSFAVAGIILGGFMRFLAHFVSGIAFFGEYAPEGQPVVIYSLVYNGGYMTMSTIICAIVAVFVLSAIPKKYFAVA